MAIMPAQRTKSPTLMRVDVSVTSHSRNREKAAETGAACTVPADERKNVERLTAAFSCGERYLRGFPCEPA